MTIRLYKAYTPGTRNRSVLGFKELVKTNPQKKLTFWKHSKQGRNSRGIITSRFRGGGHKRLYRQIDFRRNKKNISGKITTIEYDPNRTANICLVHYEDGEKKYILHPRGLKIGDTIISSNEAPILVGNALPLSAV
jgi:large subunit ribosomal protein L2